MTVNGIAAGWSDAQADCRRVFEDNRDPMWVLDVADLVDVNRAALAHYGYSRDEFLKLTIDDLVADKPGYGAAGAAAGPGSVRHHRRKDGSIIDVEVSSFPVTFSGRPASLDSVLDVTERRYAEETIRALLKEVLTAQEAERRRIARELHDDTAQTLASLLVGLRAVEASQDLGQALRAAVTLRVLVSAALEGVQRMARGLRPSVLDDLGLEDALDRLGTEVSRTHDLVVDVHATGRRVPRLPDSLEIALYRMAQEALANAVKHAAPKAVSILLYRNPTEVRLVIEDDGKGFDASAALSAGRLGLVGMRERAHLVGGSMTLESSPGNGTTICISVPLPESKPSAS
ncbi:MAG: PAS domain-containing sensor histidine kinase [Polyangia bacterium]